MKHIARVRTFLISLLLVACLIPNIALLTLTEVFAETEPEEEVTLLTPVEIEEPDTLPAFSATVAGTPYAGVETDNAESTDGTSAYQLYVNSLVDALLHLVRWESMGNSDYSQLSCTVGDTTESGNFDAVYDALYALLLQVNTTYSLYSSDNKETSISQVTRLWRIESQNVTISRQTTVSGTGRIIVVATGATNVTLVNDKQCLVKGSGATGGTLAFLGRKNAPIALQGEYNASTKKYLKRELDAMQIIGGSLYFRYTNIHDFDYSTDYKGTIVLPEGEDNARYMYMSRSSMYNITGKEGPGIFCKAYKGSSDQYTDDSELHLFASRFYNCWVSMNGAPSRGGGVIRSYAADRSNLYVRKCEFNNNVAGFNGSGSSITKPTKENGSYQGDAKTSSGGGAIYWKSAKGSALLSGCTFTGNISTALGGAVYNTGTMTIESCTFKDNMSYGYGGAIAVEPPYTATGYSSITSGGGQNKLKGSLTLDNATLIQGNVAAKDGGGIYFNAFASKIGSTAITKYTMELTIDGATIQNNTANNGGGVAMNLDYAGNNYTNGITIKAGSKIIGNTATNNGGAIWMNSTDTCACKLSKGVTMSGGLLENNQAANGGAIYIEAGNADVTTMNFVMSDGTVHHNTASANGGAAYLGGGSLTVNSGTISQNTATEKGGVAYLDAGTMTVNGGTITHNGTLSENVTTQNGGVAYLGGGTMNVAGGTITENGAVDGGAFYLLDGKMNISNGAIYKNTATQNGGAAYLGGGTLTVSGGEIYQNTATQNGGAAYLGGGTLTVSGGDIYSNAATKSGGAAYLASGEMTVSGGKIRENTATENGGAAYLGGGSLTVSGGEIFKNKAVSGGGFYITGGGLTVGGNGSISENEATDSGGGAYVDGGNVTVTGGSIVKNKAANVGGGIAINNGNYRMTGGAVDENRAENGKGGGIYIASDGASVTVDVLSGSISQNYSGADGGAIAVVGVESNGEEGIQQSINVTVGVNQYHDYKVEGDYPNVDVTCDHDGVDGAETNGCPKIKNNTSVISGGGIFISGGKDTKLSIYCLIEDANKTADGTSNSNFMMVEGGYILVDTREPNGSATNWGFVVMNSSIHVESGDVDVFGGMSNPLIMSDITIDIINKNEGSFDDERKDDGLFFKVQYYENFDGTGRYKVFSAKKGDTITISGVLFSHNGYDIIGWNTQADGTGDQTYTVNVEYTFGDFGDRSDPNKKYITENLVVYAIWEARGYFIVFDPGVESGVTVEGKMPDQALVYGEETSINPNQFIYPGYRFVGWIAVKSNVQYADGGKVLNLSSTKGDKIVFRAQWEECNHKYWSYDAFLFTEQGEGGVLERMCPCHGYTETATLTVPEGAVYTGQSYTATYDVKYVSLNQYTIANANWDLTIVYTGTNLENGETVPTNAGYYTAAITQTVGDVSYSAYLVFYIDKAQQTQSPDKPTYKVSGSADNSDNNIITVDHPNDTTGKKIEYQLRWYDGSDLKATDWGIVMEFTLSTSYTNYFVYARYAEDTNYYASDAIRADWVYYYRNGNISIQLVFDETKMDCRLEELSKEESTSGGLMIHVAAKEGYYLTSSFSVTPIDNTSRIDVKIPRSQYHLYNLPSAAEGTTLTVQIKIEGVAVKVQPTSKLGAGEIFGTVSGETATISSDSAYTAYFEISQYDANSYTDIRLEFATGLPIGTTLILLDKNTGVLWYYVVENEPVYTVRLSEFSSMGGTQSEPFSVSGETLKYQFIINFSHVNETLFISSGVLQTTLTATPKDDDGNSETETCIPELQSSVSVTLTDTPAFSITVTDVDTFEKKLRVQYAATDNGVVASKWNAFGGAIVLETVGFPSDVHVQVIEGTRTTTYYQNAQGKFIIPITTRGVTTLEVLLISDAFPSEERTYEVKATLYAACSNASSAPVNGDKKQTVTITCQKPADAQPALKVTGDQRVVGFDESLTVHVDYQGVPSGGKVEVELWARGKDKDFYSNTAADLSDAQNNSDYVVASFAGFANNEKQYSYCLMFFVKDSNGNTILTVPYYFILYDLN